MPQYLAKYIKANSSVEGVLYIISPFLINVTAEWHIAKQNINSFNITLVLLVVFYISLKMDGSLKSTLLIYLGLGNILVLIEFPYILPFT